VGHGAARHGLAGQGNHKAKNIRQARWGMVRQGMAWLGAAITRLKYKAGEAWQSQG